MPPPTMSPRMKRKRRPVPMVRLSLVSSSPSRRADPASEGAVDVAMGASPCEYLARSIRRRAIAETAGNHPRRVGVGDAGRREEGAMRRSQFVAGAVVSMMVLALPAQAKVAGEATISGPGLGGGAGGGGGDGGGSITLRGGDGSGWAAFSGLLDTARAGADRAPTADLGPRYRVVLDVRQPPQPNDIVQYLYPFAEPAPVLYTPPGQRLMVLDAPSGWWAAGADLMRLLEDVGFPDQAPVMEPAAPRVDRQAPPAPAGLSPAGWGPPAPARPLLPRPAPARPG